MTAIKILFEKSLKKVSSMDHHITSTDIIIAVPFFEEFSFNEEVVVVTPIKRFLI
jgi:hypothetical protein